MPSFQDIPQFIDSLNNYEISIFWRNLRRYLEDKDDDEKILNPDFQRGHVWTKEQQSSYLEYRLRGGHCSNRLIFACENFNSGGTGPWYLVDGLQRATAVLDFLDDKVPVFGYTYSQYDGTLRDTHHRFEIRVVDTDRKGMLQLYLDLNAGGTPHAASEIERVRKLLASS